ncbi:MAG TPA: ABC transporter ATP-binding protein [Hypericibacter adhaerens]|jgi:branched-chain amino acid transport system ATP-binding protein|uniref:ABC transporter ATP-binding protein n=1 Tax=Hypericibacter adhaerens TaxID=2602016 RepID=UPI002C56FD61|nr:ABC transporter ATP-binding protein [Hypericibacter adhaerens]HWA46068.1 ABC transporter ATP-binding protein [Hypericibacter adhaerens]
MLEVRDLVADYDKTEVVRGISFDVRAGEIVSLIGANGAGKTTTLRTLTGLKQLRSGSVRLEGKAIEGLAAHHIAGLGLAHVPEGREIFPFMTVLENLEMGGYLNRDRASLARNLEAVFERFPILRRRQRQLAGSMSGGEQQMLAIGRALMGNPKLLVLDEPSLGLSPVMCQEIVRVLTELRAAGRTIILVEQNARMALRLADRAYVLDRGRIVLEGKGRELLDDPSVRTAYLGLAPASS